MKHETLLRWVLFSASLLVLSLFILPPESIATPSMQDQKTLLFSAADSARAEADALESPVYSPANYEKAVKYYEEAQRDYQSSRNMEDVRNKIKMSSVYFLKAAEATRLFKNELADCVSARNDAIEADGPEFQKDAWKDAEKELEDAARAMEKNNLPSAQSNARKAERLFRDVELEAIKANFLNETRDLLAQAKEENVKKRAPLTLTKAQDLAQKAETALVENRYDTDEPRQLAQEARYESQHALYLNQVMEEIDKEKTSLEVVLLNSEVPIRQIADELDLNARFHEGYDPPVSLIIHTIKNMKRTIANLQQDLQDHKEQMATLSGELTRLQSQLGDLKSKEESLKQIMEQQRLAREQFKKVEDSFTPEEAQVLREQDKIIIRLYGLSFPSGKSIIESQYFGLLSKVLKAIETYPECGLTIEGHTDSFGSDATNQKLSTERAAAVKEYLTATADIAESRILAVGYGETKPVASNETKEGRRKNRRIDVVIHPKK